MRIPDYDNIDDIDDICDNIDDPIFRAKDKFKSHQRMQLIKCYYENKSNIFRFSNITPTEIEKEVNKIDSSKSLAYSDISRKIVKDNIDIFTPISHQKFDKSLGLGKFQSEMKLADVTPVFEKEVKLTKKAIG